MSVAAGRKRDFFGTVSGAYLVGPADTGLIPLVPGVLPSRIRIQKIHVEVTAPTGAELWTFQDGAGIPIVPSVSAAAIAHFDFNFGPDGVPCSVGTAFVLNISGATGARGWITWEAARSLQVMPPNYSATVLADQPVGYWRLGDPVGAVTALDSSGNGRTGTVVGGVTFGQAGAVDGTAALFDGATGKITLGLMPSPAACSYEAWIKTSNVAAQAPFLTNYSAAAAGLYVGKGGTKVFVYSGLGGISVLSNASIVTGAWVHVVVTSDGATTRIYINGQLDTTQAQPNQNSSTFPWAIGFGNVTEYWPGNLNEVAFYATVLTPERIAQHYRAGLAR